MNKRESSNKSLSVSCCCRHLPETAAWNCVCESEQDLHQHHYTFDLFDSHSVCDYAASVQPLLSWFISEHWHLIAFYVGEICLAYSYKHLTENFNHSFCDLHIQLQFRLVRFIPPFLRVPRCQDHKHFQEPEKRHVFFSTKGITFILTPCSCCCFFHRLTIIIFGITLQ